jgi:hypothetical protein
MPQDDGGGSPSQPHCGSRHGPVDSVMGNTYASIESGKNRTSDGYARRTCGYFGVAVPPPPPPQSTLMKAARSVRKGVNTLKKHKMETGSIRLRLRLRLRFRLGLGLPLGLCLGLSLTFQSTLVQPW